MPLHWIYCDEWFLLKFEREFKFGFENVLKYFCFKRKEKQKMKKREEPSPLVLARRPTPHPPVFPSAQPSAEGRGLAKPRASASVSALPSLLPLTERSRALSHCQVGPLVRPFSYLVTEPESARDRAPAARFPRLACPASLDPLK